MKSFKKIPMLIFLLVLYDIFIIIGKIHVMGNVLLKLKMISGVTWYLTVADFFIILGLIMLFFEMIKSTRGGRAEVAEHTVSTLVFIIFLIEFIVIKGACTSVFFILSLMSLFDVVAGFTITIATSHKEIMIEGRQ
jgi:hypothetical protein